MLGFDDRRLVRADGVDSVQCPVHCCPTRVPVQQRTFRRSREFFCQADRICIGRSTFEYEGDVDNLHSHRPGDLELLAAIKPFKRESRVTLERSDDALTWNVFRHLETSGRLAPWLVAVTSGQASAPVVHYWSFEASTGDSWTPLAEARAACGEMGGRGSEPHLVITTYDAHA